PPMTPRSSVEMRPETEYVAVRLSFCSGFDGGGACSGNDGSGIKFTPRDSDETGYNCGRTVGSALFASWESALHKSRQLLLINTMYSKCQEENPPNRPICGLRRTTLHFCIQFQAANGVGLHGNSFVNASQVFMRSR